MQIFAEEVREGDFADFGYKSIDEVEVEVNESSNCSSPSSSSSSSPCHFDPWMLNESLSRVSFSYRELTLDPIELTVLKLDGSSFDIIVSKKAKVGDLKQAVEDEFSDLSEQGIGHISWSHVWGQFCLCFEDQKLLNDQNSIKLYGIEDGDQLQFIRHTSTNDNLRRQRSEKQDYEFEEPVKSSSKSVSYDDTQNNEGNEKKIGSYYEDIGVAIKYRSSWLHIMRRRFSYCNLDLPDVRYRALSTSSTSNSAGGSPDVFEDMTITSYYNRL